MKPRLSIEEINEAMDELRQALLEERKAGCAIIDAHTKKTKAHHRVLLAQDAVRYLKFY